MLRAPGSTIILAMKPVILVIDDEEAIRLFLKATLEDEGYAVVTYGKGQEVLDDLERTLPDLVLLDLMLPDMSGIQVLEKIKKRMPHVCVVIVTAYDKTDSAVQAMKLDAYDYVSKPIQLDELFRVIARGLEDTAELRANFRATNHTDLFRGIEDFVPSLAPAMAVMTICPDSGPFFLIPPKFFASTITMPLMPESLTSMLVPPPMTRRGSSLFRQPLISSTRSSGFSGNAMTSAGPPTLNEVCPDMGSSNRILPPKRSVSHRRVSWFNFPPFYSVSQCLFSIHPRPPA